MSNLKLLAQGAEAKIFLEKKENLIIKDRISKLYRIPEIDNAIRKRRTRAEIKLLQKASHIINVPKPKENNTESKIFMPFIEGQKLSEILDSLPLNKQKPPMNKIGKNIALLHKNDIIHGDLTTSNMILVENNQKIKSKNLKKLLLRLKELNLPLKEYAIFGSGALSIRGIRENRDLDIIVKRKLWNKLIKKYPVKEYLSKEYLEFEKIEIWRDWRPLQDNVDKIIDNAEIISGIRFVNLYDLIKLKEIQNREKDKQDIKLIEKYLSENSKEVIDNLDLFFIDFGLGYFSQKIEDKAVDLHLLRQALESRHFKNWEKLLEEVIKSYEKEMGKEQTKKILERIAAIEKRGRYRH